MFWILFLLLFLFAITRTRIVRRYIRRCINSAVYTQRKRELIREWKREFPNLIDELDGLLDVIFESYGLISPEEYFNIQILFDNEIWIKSIEQIKKLLSHCNRILWRFINRIRRNKGLREILRKQIKVIDDEELIIAA